MLVSRVFFIAVLLYLASFCSAESLVPVLAWSNSDALSAVQSTSNPQIDGILKNIKVDKLEVAVVVKASKLSFDDIAKYGGVYGEMNAPLSSLQSFLSTSESSLSTGVSGEPASDITKYLSFAMGTLPLYITEWSQLPKISGSQKFVIVVELPEDNGERMFRAHDKIISEVVASLSTSDVPYAVFYTADHSSSRRSVREATDYRRSTFDEVKPDGGMLPRVEGDDSVCYHQSDIDGNSSCLLFCFTSPIIDYTYMDGNETRKATTKLNETLPLYISGTCNTTEDSKLDGLDVIITDPDVTYAYMAFEMMFYENHTNSTGDIDVFNRTIVFAFVAGNCDADHDNNTRSYAGCGFWTMIVASRDNQSSNFTEYRRNRPEKVFTNLAVPLTSSPDTRTDISYACGNNSLNKFVSLFNGTESDESYNFVGIQVQPFAKIKPIRNTLIFGSAYNCQGYFGAVTWMGVFSILILIVIIYVSIVFVFSISTLDRFDDARGSTINVENLH